MERKFISLGGTINYNSEVSKINIENNKFHSICVNEKIVKADILISCIKTKSSTFVIAFFCCNILNSPSAPKLYIHLIFQIIFA